METWKCEGAVIIPQNKQVSIWKENKFRAQSLCFKLILAITRLSRFANDIISLESMLDKRACFWLFALSPLSLSLSSSPPLSLSLSFSRIKPHISTNDYTIFSQRFLFKKSNLTSIVFIFFDMFNCQLL